MKFSRDSVSAVTVRNVAPGSISFAEQTFACDVIVTPDDVIEQPFPPSIPDINEQDVARALECEPEILIIGTGWGTALPPGKLTFALARRGIGLETMDTPAACRTLNILIGEGRRPAAILKVTADD